MIPKNTGYRTRRQRKRAHYRTARGPAREAAYRRDGGRCRWPTCRRALWLESDNAFTLANGHEIDGGRSKVDPTDPAKIVTLCAVCHADIHPRVGGVKKRIEGSDANGRLRFFERHKPDSTMNEWTEYLDPVA